MLEYESTIEPIDAAGNITGAYDFGIEYDISSGENRYFESVPEISDYEVFYIVDCESGQYYFTFMFEDEILDFFNDNYEDIVQAGVDYYEDAAAADYWDSRRDYEPEYFEPCPGAW